MFSFLTKKKDDYTKSDRRNATPGRISVWRRIYLAVIQGEKVTLANGRKYIRTKRGPWVRAENYLRHQSPMRLGLPSNGWINEMRN